MDNLLDELEEIALAIDDWAWMEDDPTRGVLKSLCAQLADLVEMMQDQLRVQARALELHARLIPDETDLCGGTYLSQMD